MEENTRELRLYWIAFSIAGGTLLLPSFLPLW
jgi:hypothetical protein